MDDYLLKCYLFVALATFSSKNWRLWLKITVTLFCIYTIFRRFYPLPIILLDYTLESIFIFQGIVEPMFFIVCFSSAWATSGNNSLVKNGRINLIEVRRRRSLYNRRQPL